MTLINRRTFIAGGILPLLSIPVKAGSKYGKWNGDEAPGTIVIITDDKTLHLVGENGTRTSYPIAVGKEGLQWYGETSVVGKKKNPDWRPTPAMKRRNPKLPDIVKGGPDNPMGTRAIYLAEGYLRIHGTNNPKSIGTEASSGCYRLYPDDIIELFNNVEIGAKVIVVK